jgi:hypothetical protein
MNKKYIDMLTDKQLQDIQKLDNIGQLPRQFEAYTPDTKLDYILKHYTEKHGVEPKHFFHLKCGATNMIVVEVKS